MSFIKDLLFPKFCLGCGFLGDYVCTSCSRKLLRGDSDVCIYCRKPSVLGLTHNRCRKVEGIDGFLFVFQYNNTLKKILKNIKYRLVKEALSPLLLQIKEDNLSKLKTYKDFCSSLVFQPIPMTRKKMNQRGFNQAEIVTQYLCSRLTVPAADYLIRVRENTPQAQIKEIRERQDNIRGCFSVNNSAEKNEDAVVLIDDVVTTGATVREAARMFKSRMAVKKVFVFSLAKG